ncbi:hypothetical protein M0R45_029981 [Rubus argutus]|uniref:Uncharacterized protein n=1 Tax=Rubus argutus TaxID=59490 RepID=A0AAW1W9N9_RUBAR
MFSLLRTSLGSPVRRSRESAFAMLPLVHKQAIPSRCGVGYTAPFEQAKRILPDPRSDHEAAVHADRQLLNFSGLLFRNDRHVIDLQTLEHLRSMVARFWIEESTLQLEATTQFMKLLSNERSLAIEEVIQSVVVPRFVEFLMRKDFPQL